MKTIAQQAEVRGKSMAELIGKTVEEIRSMGFDVSPSVPPGSVLRRDDGSVRVTGEPTGYVWSGFKQGRLRLVRGGAEDAAPAQDDRLHVRFYPYRSDK